MTQIILHAVTSVLTVAVWTILSGDLGQAAGVTTLYWLIFWALAEMAERRGYDLGGGSKSGEPATKAGGCGESKKVIQETRKLLDSEDLFEIAIGGGRREALKELDLWEEGT